jgi:hypothetical protein
MQNSMDDMRNKTSQEIFDIVVSHLRKQGLKSGNSLVCLYRGPNEMKCAIGCLIPNSSYFKSMEGKLIDELISIDSFLWMKDHLRLLNRLQKIHDYYDVDQWEDQLQLAANRFGLVLISC